MDFFAKTIDRAERAPWPWVRRGGLRVRWFDGWSLILERALGELPESSECSHELFEALVRNRSRVRKCVALVSEADRPVAVVGLRRIGPLRWDVIGGGGVAPRFVAYAANPDLFRALSALGVNVHVTTQPEAPPRNWVKSVQEHPVYRIGLDSDFEGYWRQSGQLKYLKKSRRRTEALTIEIDARPAAEWIIRSWATHWRSPETSSWEDLIVSAEHYRKADRFHTIRLLDGGEPVAGSSFLVENGGLLYVTTYTRPEYRQLGAGTRVLDFAFAWAADFGFKHMDVGVGHEYKKRWAPESAMRWSYDIRPWHVDVAAALVQRGRAALRHASLPARSFFGKNPLRLNPGQTTAALSSSDSIPSEA